LFKDPIPHLRPMILISGAGWDRDNDFGPGGSSARNDQLPSDPLRPLPHSDQAEMPLAPTLAQHRSWHPAAVVADRQPELTASPLKQDFNGGAASVADCVPDRFLDDALKLLADEWMKDSRIALLRQQHARRVAAHLLGGAFQKGIGELRRPALRAKLRDAVAALDQNLLSASKRGIK
jgi:hypothetical protein